MRISGNQECVLCTVFTAYWIADYGNTGAKTCKDDDDDDRDEK